MDSAGVDESSHSRGPRRQSPLTGASELDYCCGTSSQRLPSSECESSDVVVSDVRMPGLNGFELASHILDDFGSIQVVLMTADPTAGMTENMSQPVCHLF